MVMKVKLNQVFHDEVGNCGGGGGDDDDDDDDKKKTMTTKRERF
jgi:hypothetical protein